MGRLGFVLNRLTYKAGQACCQSAEVINKGTRHGALRTEEGWLLYMWYLSVNLVDATTWSLEGVL